MRQKFLGVLFLCIALQFSCVAHDPINVLIIGGGPAGLATAIEAQQNGAQVSIVEKRDNYSRLQWVVLFNSSIQLLEKWKVEAPQMKLIDRGNGEKIGFVPINHLEARLEARAKELGVKKIQGEFVGLHQHKAPIVTQGRKTALAYDIIVGADGPHSHVREALHIENNFLGQAKAISALIPLPEGVGGLYGISPAQQNGDIFIKRIRTASASIIFMQTTNFDQKLDLRKEAQKCGWEEEVALMDAGKALVSDNIQVLFQQATTFSDEKESAILVGDAAATASFLEGMGANTALRAAALAGDFLKKVQRNDVQAYDSFNKEMKVTTDEMLEQSRYLFTSSS